MNLAYIFIAGYSKISCFNESTVYVLALNFPHFFFISNSKVLTDEFWIYSDYLDYLVPELENLASHLIQVLHQLKSDLIWITQIHS